MDARFLADLRFHDLRHQASSVGFPWLRQLPFITTKTAGELTVRVVGEVGLAIDDKVGLSPMPGKLLRSTNRNSVYRPTSEEL